MIGRKRVLAVIPARGGSKGLLRKNIKEINGKPLIIWTIEQAFGSRYLTDIVVSTDDQEIAIIAEQAGAKVPFLRPVDLATDESSPVDVVEHLLSNLESEYDICCLLEPTSPLRKPEDIDLCVKLLIDNWDKTDGVISVGKIHLENPFLAKKVDKDGYISNFLVGEKESRRQELQSVYFPYGVFYGVKVLSFLKERTFYLNRTFSYLIDRWQNYEVDDELDLIIIEKIMQTFIDDAH